MEYRTVSSWLIALVLVGTFAFFSIFCLLAFLYIGIYWGAAGSGRQHQEFAANYFHLIDPARQMGATFEDCRHYVTDGANYNLFNSVAYFGDRYELTMQVPVVIESESIGRTVGEPKFHLNEISRVEIIDGAVSAHNSRSIDFGAKEWKLIYEADGDFAAIGFTIVKSSVEDFELFKWSSR